MNVNDVKTAAAVIYAVDFSGYSVQRPREQILPEQVAQYLFSTAPIDRLAGSVYIDDFVIQIRQQIDQTDDMVQMVMAQNNADGIIRAV